MAQKYVSTNYIPESYQRYKQECNKFARLTDSETCELLKDPTDEHKERVCKAYMWYVFVVFESTVTIYNDIQKNDIEDYIQEGMCGLVRAIDMYDPHHRASFKTYAAYWIKKYIYIYLRDNWSIRMPANIIGLMYKVLRFMSEYHKKSGEDPDITYMAAQLQKKPEEIQNALDTYKILSVVYMDAKEDEDDESPFKTNTFHHQQRCNNPVEDAVVEKVQREYLYAFLLHKLILKEIDKNILYLILFSSDILSHKEIGNNLGCSRQYISRRIGMMREQIEAHQLKKVLTAPYECLR